MLVKDDSNGMIVNSQGQLSDSAAVQLNVGNVDTTWVPTVTDVVNNSVDTSKKFALDDNSEIAGSNYCRLDGFPLNDPMIETSKCNNNKSIENKKQYDKSDRSSLSLSISSENHRLIDHRNDSQQNGGHGVSNQSRGCQNYTQQQSHDATPQSTDISPTIHQTTSPPTSQPTTPSGTQSSPDKSPSCVSNQFAIKFSTQEGQNIADSDCINIIHFNDCYNVEPGPQSSGAAGFLSALKQQKARLMNEPLILFSGDIMSPSFMSTFTKGEQMIPVLNDLGVHCAVFGNHEFDYGVDNLIGFVKQTSFPWLLSNVIDKETSNQLGDGKVYHILERQGVKIGLIGLIEEEWLSTLSTLDSSDVIYEDFLLRGRQLARWLKCGPHQVDYVIALTHSRKPNDIRLADNAPEIDIILGGHDHDYDVEQRPNGMFIVKSGTDFREFSLIRLRLNPKFKELKSLQQNHGKPNNTNINMNTSDIEAPAYNSNLENFDHLDRFEVEKISQRCNPVCDISIDHVRCLNYEQDPELKQKLDKFVVTIDEKMGKVLGHFNCDLDGRFASIRNYETNLGNFVTDIMLASTHADLAILNSGTLRSDRIHPKGEFTMRDLFNILGYIDPISVLNANGYQIWKALENGVSQWPKLEGRFPQISGCSFVFDPKKPPGQRIKPEDICVGEEPLNLQKLYRLTTKAYLASGKDGYDMLKDCEVLMPGDESPDLTTSILNHFEAINIIKSNRRTHHRQSIICLSRSSIQRILADQSLTTNHHNDHADAGAHHQSEEHQATDTNNNSNHQQDHLNQNNQGHLNHVQGEQKTVNEQTSGANNSQSELMQSESFDDDPSSLAETNQNISLMQHVGPNSPMVGAISVTPVRLSGSLKVDSSSFDSSSPQLGGHMTPAWNCQRTPRSRRLMSLDEMELEQCKLEPKIEGRIRILGVNFEYPEVESSCAAGQQVASSVVC